LILKLSNLFDGKVNLVSVLYQAWQNSKKPVIFKTAKKPKKKKKMTVHHKLLLLQYLW